MDRTMVCRAAEAREPRTPEDEDEPENENDDQDEGILDEI
jgi:hypothetical protein